jgi:hypothetical protein
VLLSSLTYCLAQGTEAPLAAIRGTVLNSITHEPVPRALVTLMGNVAALTDDQGRFDFPIQSSVQMSSQVDVRKPGFSQTVAGFSRSPETGDTNLTVSLAPESLITGRVNLPASNQYDRINVQLYKRQIDDGRAHWVNAGTQSTRSNGEFRFAELEPGSYKILTSELLDRDPLTFDPQGQLYGYPPIYYPTASDFAAAAPIALEAGKTFQLELSPALQPYYPVKIAVPNMPDGSFLQVSVALQGHKGPGYSLGYNGQQAIEGMLPSGTYTVEATLQGPQQSAFGITTITVRNAPLINATVTLLPNASIPVNIRSEFTARLPADQMPTFGGPNGASRRVDADVSLRAAADFQGADYIGLRPPRRPNDNALVLENVHPGRYWLQVQPYHGYPASITSNGVDLLRSPLVVAPGATPGPIEIVLRDDGATIEGTIDGSQALRSNSDSGAIESFAMKRGAQQGPVVYAIPAADSPGRFSQTGVASDGTFTLPNLPPGAYRLLAFDHQPGEFDYRNPEAMRAYDEKGPTLRLSPNQTEHLHLTLIRTE